MINKLNISYGKKQKSVQQNYNNTQAPNRGKTIIMDDFCGNSAEDGTDINQDGIPELWHGYKVKGAFLAAGSHKDLPMVEKLQDKNSPINYNKILKNLIKRNSDNKNDNNVITMLNNSGGFFLTFDEMSILAEKRITPKNIKTNKDLITKDIKFKYYADNDEEFYTGKDEVKYLMIDEILENQEKLTKTAKLYTSAGNWGEKFCNLFSMSDNVKTIGGLDEHGYPHKESGNNAFIGKNDWAPFKFVGKLITEKNGKTGYDLAPKGKKGDGEVDIDLADIKLSSKNPPDKKIEIIGTSYSTPYKLGKDFIAKQNGSTEWIDPRLSARRREGK